MNDKISTKERIIDLIGSKTYDYFPNLESCRHKPHLFFVRQSFFSSFSPFRPQHKIYKLIIQVEKKSREVFVKIHENPVSAQKEYEDALHCWKTFSSENFSVSQPLDILPEVNAVIFSKVDGISLQSLLNRAFFFGMYRFKGTYLTEYIARAGRWLRAFHDTFVTRKSLIDVDKIMSQIEEGLNSSRARVEHNSIAVICSRARNKAKKNHPEDVKTSLLHGNFVPSHIFVYGQKVSVIDFEKLIYGPVYYDLCSLTLSLDLMFKIFHSHVGDLKKSFFLGYFGEEEIPEPTIQLYKIHRMAIKLRFPLPTTFQNKFTHRLYARVQVNRALALLKKMKSNRTVDIFR